MATNTDKDTSEYEEDFTPKTAKRKISKPMIITAAIVIGLVGLGIAGYFIYEGYYYYQTDNAKVDTMIYKLTADASGKLLKVYVSQGQQVKAGQTLARVASGPFIISPTDGTVTDINMHEGDYVNASDVILVVAETSDMYITANVEESDILKIHPGQNVLVTLDVYGKTLDGYVDEISPVTMTKLTGSTTSFTTSGTYTKVTQLIPIKIKLSDSVDLANIIGTNATVKIKIR
jgi:multidrug resistance efflux pump